MCDFCKATETMKRIMKLLDPLPVFDVPLYDDAISDVYNAADNAQGILRPWPGCQPENEEQQKLDERPREDVTKAVRHTYLERRLEDGRDALVVLCDCDDCQELAMTTYGKFLVCYKHHGELLAHSSL